MNRKMKRGIAAASIAGLGLGVAAWAGVANASQPDDNGTVIHGNGQTIQVPDGVQLDNGGSFELPDGSTLEVAPPAK
jgi:hypothetical protein